MSATEPESDGKQELNDSGCVQDESLPRECPPKGSLMKPQVAENGYTGQAQLLDLSDDVLLYILKYCSPHDLKALGFTCARLGALVLERSLWVTVDARDVSTSRARMHWLLGALHEGTRNLLLTGYAEQAKGCRGHVNRTRKDVEDEHTKHDDRRDDFLSGRRGIDFDGRYYAAQSTIREVDAPVEIPNLYGPGGPEPPFPLIRQHARLHINAQQLPRQSSSPSWPEDCEWDDPDAEQVQEESSEDTAGCPGPVFTLSAPMIKEIRTRCPKLTSLSLQRCNINCNKISPSIFPPTLKRLSFRGTRCYNPPLDKSYLFRIHDYLPALEYLDLSECAWLEPAALLPLSKLVNLKVLLMRECPAMAEFVAYVSLATRYGFRALKVLDLRGSPVGDSEVSALGWLPELQELYLEAPRTPPPTSTPMAHHHYIGDPLPKLPHMDEWELQIPEYYLTRSWSESESAESSMEDVEGQVEMLRDTYDHPTAPFSIELHTRVIQAAPRALAHLNEEPQEEDDDNDEGVQQINLGQELSDAVARMHRPAQGNEGVAQGNEGRAQINAEDEARQTNRPQVNAPALKNEAQTVKGRGIRRTTDEQPDEAGPSKRNKQLNEQEQNGGCSKANKKDDSDRPKPFYKYKIFKHKNFVNENAAGPSNNDKKGSEKNILKTTNNQNVTIKPGPSDKMNRETEDLLLNATDAIHDTIKALQCDEENSQGSKQPDDGPTQPKKPLNYEDEYKTYKYNLQVNDGAGPSKETKPKSNVKISLNVGESRESKIDTKGKSISAPKYNNDVSDGAGTSGYFMRDRLNPDGEPSAKKLRRNINDKQNEKRKTKRESSETEKSNAGANNHDKEDMQASVKPEVKNKRLQPKDLAAAAGIENKPKEQPEKEREEETPEESPQWVRPSGKRLDDAPEQRMCQQEEKETDAAQVERPEDAGTERPQRAIPEAPEQQEIPQDEPQNEEADEEQPQADGRREIRIQPNLPPQYVRFRRNQEPVIIQCPMYRNEPSANPQPANQLPAVAENQANQAAEPRNHVLYVNLGQQLHAVYRLLPHRPFRTNHRQPPQAEHLDNSSLVSDASIRRFGRADGEDVNIVHIGPNGPQFGGRDTSGRPNRSNLRILTATGYRHITNRSLVHLATAAPHLQTVDFSNTSVSAEGVEQFKTLRPEVEVKFCMFKDEENEE